MVAGQVHAEDGFEAGAEHPAGGPGVPGPSAPAHVRLHRVDVGRHDVGLDPVALGLQGSDRVVDRVDEREELAGPVRASQCSPGEHGPHGGVRVLPAVLPHPGRVCPDVARVGGGLHEGWGEEASHLLLVQDEVPVDRVHGRASPLGVPGTGQCRPALGDGVDPALLALGGAQWGAVVEVAAAVPAAVPACLLERVDEPLLLLAPAAYDVVVAPSLGEGQEVVQGRVQEPAQPDALATTRGTHPVHPVVPVTRAEEWQTMGPPPGGLLQGQQAVLVERDAAPGVRGVEEPLVLALRQRCSGQEPDLFVEH